MPFQFPKISRSKLLYYIVIPFILSLVVTFTLQYAESTRIEQLTFVTTITISNETRYCSPCKVLVEKGYFDSIGEVYVYMSSPYACYWKIFNVWMSLDNSSWTSVPFLDSDTNNLAQMASLGFINLGNPQLTIYVKYYIPPQTLTVPPGVTKEELSVFEAHVLIKKRATPADTGLWITTFFGVFAFISHILSILDVQKFKKRKKKKSHVKTMKRKIRVKNEIKDE